MVGNTTQQVCLDHRRDTEAFEEQMKELAKHLDQQAGAERKTRVVVVPRERVSKLSCRPRTDRNPEVVE